ncbi:hypothetical protein DID88_006517 [Monilinia fructigena]|uniref:CP-type G domain-containing protein n=1 Tax=Monilinia fructigena TaxID=38457 RepID=A0A395IJK5_9HELO|nr:hypothetical protein DID88_006517 [Monilinia fructigena]
MVLAKSKNAVGLGNSLMNDRFGKGKGADRKKTTATGIQRTHKDTGETYVTNEKQEASWVKMRSVTEQAALDEFLSTAELAGTDFTAEKMNNVKIIHTDQKNPYLLSASEERAAVGKQKAHKERLTVPRRPKWDSSTTPQELDRMERDGLLEWRRGLAELQENNDLLMTPFERNLEVWRQLWRVIERSDLIVQIVDARNPLLFRSEDLERYVKDVDSRKENLLLVNKADMLTLEQRQHWADYFEAAAMSEETEEETKASTSASKLAEKAKALGLDDEIDDDDNDSEEESDEQGEGTNAKDEESDDDELAETESTRILTVDELEALFLVHAPDVSRKTQIGLVGYPNVGKSSTINALIGAKKVSVSSTPGKTKHFQTIHLSDKVLLCDCPGLVFPNFATTKAELVCNGILPIDQLREFVGPAGLVAHRIPQGFLEALYGMKIVTRPLEEGGTGIPTAEEMLTAYARARGFRRTGQGQPDDESRAARHILKDYVNGKLLFCQPPPLDIDPFEFNRELYDEGHLPEKRRQALASMASSADDQTSVVDADIIEMPQGLKSKNLDSTFFAQGQGNSAHLRMPFSHKYSEQGTASGKQLSGRKQATLIALEKDMDPNDLKKLTSKKHFKGNKPGGKGKRRANYFAD